MLDTKELPIYMRLVPIDFLHLDRFQESGMYVFERCLQQTQVALLKASANTKRDLCKVEREDICRFSLVHPGCVVASKFKAAGH